MGPQAAKRSITRLYITTPKQIIARLAVYFAKGSTRKTNGISTSDTTELKNSRLVQSRHLQQQRYFSQYHPALVQGYVANVYPALPSHPMPCTNRFKLINHDLAIQAQSANLQCWRAFTQGYVNGNYVIVLLGKLLNLWQPFSAWCTPSGKVRNHNIPWFSSVFKEGTTL